MAANTSNNRSDALACEDEIVRAEVQHQATIHQLFPDGMNIRSFLPHAQKWAAEQGPDAIPPHIEDQYILESLERPPEGSTLSFVFWIGLDMETRREATEAQRLMNELTMRCDYEAAQLVQDDDERPF